MLNIQHNVSLQPYNTFGLQATASHFVEVTSEDDLQKLTSEDIFKTNQKLILGGGSNILLTNDFTGLVIKMNIKGIERTHETADHVFFEVGAGETWHDFVLFSVKSNLGGIENLSLIPGTVGAAPMQNIGAYGIEQEAVFEKLNAVFYDGTLKTFEKKDCDFGYRESVFKKSLKNKCIITKVTYRLSKNPSLNTSYGAISNVLDEKGIVSPTISDVSNAVIEIRQSKLPDPAKIGNSGSFFKNPEISKSSFEKLHSAHPEVPHYPAPDDKIKVPAGWLIEQAGWKGKTIGNIGVHKNQALVLVNYGGGKGQEILNLAMDIKASVKEKFDIDIHPEVNVI